MECKNEKDGSVLIFVPAGEFTMGNNDHEDEKPQHKVFLSEYYIGKYEVTNAQFSLFVKEAGFTAKGEWKEFAKPGRENHPVINVSWYDAVAYCKWAGLRLPTEAEWEKAARGTDGRKWPWGNEWDKNLCNNWNTDRSEVVALLSCINENRDTLPVGSFPGGASPYGALDMSGNVWEWCEDKYHDSYNGAPLDGSAWLSPKGEYRILRGGSWNNASAGNLRCALRNRGYPGGWNSDFSFRVGRSSVIDD